MSTENSLIKILIIDDESAIREVMSATLRDEGFTVSTAADGEAGLKALKESQPDIVFLDITLPDMTGIEVMKQIRSQYSSNIRIIVITSHAHSWDLDYFEEMKATLVVAKPITAEQVAGFLEFSHRIDGSRLHQRDLSGAVHAVSGKSRPHPENAAQGLDLSGRWRDG